MKKSKIFFLILSLLLVQQVNLFAQDVTNNQSNELAKKSLWKGFERLDFKIGGKSTWLIAPDKALAGNPWIWRARFPGWHTDADSILISEGFHLVHINTANQFGSPKAVKAWDEMYAHVTTKYKLNEKVALMGVSRGGCSFTIGQKVIQKKCLVSMVKPLYVTSRVGQWERMENEVMGIGID